MRVTRPRSCVGLVKFAAGRITAALSPELHPLCRQTLASRQGDTHTRPFFHCFQRTPAKAYCLGWGTLRARRQLERQTREPWLSPPTQHILRDINWLTEFVMGSKREPTGLRPLAGAPFQNDQGVFSWLADAGTPGSPTGPPQGRYAQQPAVRANQAPGESAV